MKALSEKLKSDLFYTLLEQEELFGVYEKYNGIVDFLNLIWPLKEMASEDPRFSNAEEDAIQHLINNQDWDYEYLFVDRLKLLTDNERYQAFIETLISPQVRGDRGQIAYFASLINGQLATTTVRLVLSGTMDDLPVYRLQTRTSESDRPIDIAPNQIPFYHSASKIPKEYPHFLLRSSDWDDFHNKTTFSLLYVESSKKFLTIGGLKLMKRGYQRTMEALPETFNTLSPDWCSLGQEERYYKDLLASFGQDYLSILLALRDVALFPRIHEEFEEDDIYKASLIRFNEAEQLARTIKYSLNGYESGDWYKFTYEYHLPYAVKPIALHFDFDAESVVKHRVFALIGKNGTGKTQILSSLAKELSKTNYKNLFPRKPLYSKIFTVSYSIFDHFQIPESDAAFNYVYCGLKKTDGSLLNENEIVGRILESETLISYKSITRDWYAVLQNFIPPDLLDEIFTGKGRSLLFQPHLFHDFYRKLSSGQNILMLIISEIMAKIRFNSLILYDEPETHLHPNAVTSLMNTIFDLVGQFDSYCILATHSPLVIQEIQARNVIIIERENNLAYIRQMEKESFGENLTVITEDIFGNRNMEKHHLTLIRTLVDRKDSYESILEHLSTGNLPLNLNTRLYIKGLIQERDEKS